MTEINDEVYEHIDRLIPVVTAIAEITDESVPGQFRFKARFPEECDTAQSAITYLLACQASDIRHFGYWLREVLRDIDETDAVFANNPNGSRARRKQVAALAKSAQRANKAWEKLAARMSREAWKWRSIF